MLFYTDPYADRRRLKRRYRYALWGFGLGLLCGLGLASLF